MNLTPRTDAAYKKSEGLGTFFELSSLDTLCRTLEVELQELDSIATQRALEITELQMKLNQAMHDYDLQKGNYVALVEAVLGNHPYTSGSEDVFEIANQHRISFEEANHQTQ